MKQQQKAQTKSSYHDESQATIKTEPVIDISRDSIPIQAHGGRGFVVNLTGENVDWEFEDEENEFGNEQNSDDEVIKEMDCNVTTPGGNISNNATTKDNDKFSSHVSYSQRILVCLVKVFFVLRVGVLGLKLRISKY